MEHLLTVKHFFTSKIWASKTKMLKLPVPKYFKAYNYHSLKEYD